MYENDIRDLDGGAWAETNPYLCPCRGRGWLLSDFDTFHKCPVHGANVPHPEDDYTDFDYGDHLLKMARKAFATFREVARRNGFKGNFTQKCWKTVGSDDPTPKQWVDAAESVAVTYARFNEETTARRLGYSCALEMRWADEAAEEKRDRF